MKKQEARGVYAPEVGGKGRKEAGGEEGGGGEPALRNRSSVSSPTHHIIPSLKCVCQKRTSAKKQEKY